MKLCLELTVIFLWCLLLTSTSQANFIMPKWTREISDEKLMNVPKSVIQLQDSLLYPIRAFLQNMFSSQYQIDKSRMLQVQIKRKISSEISKY